MNETILNGLKGWVLDNYRQYTTGFTWERSAGHCADCFYDGEAYGTSWAAYEVGSMLGMDLPEPECEDECDD